MLCVHLLLSVPFVLPSQNKVERILQLKERSDSVMRIDAKTALKFAEEAWGLSETLKIDSLEYESGFQKAVANAFLGNLNVALEDFISSKALAQKLKDPARTIKSLNAIGNIYREINRLDMALQSYKEALQVCGESKNYAKYCLVESNLVIFLNQIKATDSSIAHCYRALDLVNQNKGGKQNHLYKVTFYSTLMNDYIDKKNLDSINKYSEIILPMQLEAGDKLGYAGNLYNLGTFYSNTNKDYSSAEKYYLLAAKNNPGNLGLMIEIKLGLANASFELKNYKQSAMSYWECLKLKDSTSKMQTVDKLSEMEVKYETGKKEEELRRLSVEKQIDDLKVKQSKIWLLVSVAGILFVVMIAVVLFRQNKSRRRANELLQHKNDEIINQKKEITDSINYAKRIQLAILPPDKMVKRLLPNAFVFYKPKDVVSGDFYWLEEKNGLVLFAAVDCTGHGVPGAMMSVVGLNLLNQAVKEKGLTKPSDILQHLDTGVTDTLRQSGDDESIKDGMDLSLCTYDPKKLELQYAGAFNNLWVVRENISSSYQPQSINEVFFENHLLEIKADKFPIGSNLDGVADNYNNYKLQLQKGDCVYLYSDGFADQFGGPKGKKFKYNYLKKLLISIHDLSPEEQREKLNTTIENWKGDLEQVDDILVIGVCI
jgi:serine phosphatase RsbU (regulator of sigma subunit)/tetratricopeptide (TPR) repeat protein